MPPPSVRVVAPGGHPDGCCAGCCPDPREPCCCGPDAGLPSLADMGGREVPCDCACFWTTMAALMFTIGGLLLLFVSVPSIPEALAVSPSDDSGLQAAVCGQALEPSTLSGCSLLVATLQGAQGPSQGQARRDPRPIAGPTMAITSANVLHAPLLAVLLHSANLLAAAVYLVPAFALWVVLVAALTRHVFDTTPPATQPEPSSAKPFTAAAPPVGQPMSAKAQLAAASIPPAPAGGMRDFLLANDTTFQAAMGMWPGLAAALLVSTAIVLAAVVPVADAAVSGAKDGPLKDVLTSFQLRVAIALGLAAPTVFFPILQFGLRLAMWLVGGIPWLLYRFAGDRRVTHRVVNAEGVLVDDTCSVSCCIAVDMTCCPCCDICQPQPEPAVDTPAEKSPSPMRSHTFGTSSAGSRAASPSVAPPTVPPSRATSLEAASAPVDPAEKQVAGDNVPVLMVPAPIAETNETNVAVAPGTKKDKKEKKEKKEKDDRSGDKSKKSRSRSTEAAAVVPRSSDLPPKPKRSSSKLSRQSSRRSSVDTDGDELRFGGSFSVRSSIDNATEGGDDGAKALAKAERRAKRRAKKEAALLEKEPSSALETAVVFDASDAEAPSDAAVKTAEAPCALPPSRAPDRTCLAVAVEGESSVVVAPPEASPTLEL